MPSSRWWFFWLGAGLIAGGGEIILNACFLRFPVLAAKLSACPGCAVAANCLGYMALWVMAALLIGGALELVRRAVRATFSLHIIAAAIALICGVIYLAYGIESSNPGNLVPSGGWTESYYPLIPWWWLAVGVAVSLIDGLLLILIGFPRKPRRAARWLATLALALAVFNVLDHELSRGFPRWLLAALLVLLAFLIGMIMERHRIAPTKIVLFTAGTALLASGVLGIYFGWPGHDFNGHIIMMIWDAQRPDRMSVYGYDRPTTPTLSDWKRHMVRFDRAYSPANYTFPSHVSIFSGRYVREHRLYDGTEAERAIYESFENLPDVMSRKGYQPLLLTENPWLHPLRKGFQQAYIFPTRREAPPVFLFSYRRPFLARQMMDNIRFNIEGLFKSTVVDIEDRLFAEWLIRARREGPYFLVVNWMYAHSRYYPGCPWGLHFDDNKGLREFPIETYNRATEYMDHRLGGWIKLLEKTGQLDHSLVLLTADHGELLGEHGLVGHGKTLLDPVLHVPLLLFGPEVEPAVIEKLAPLVQLKSALSALTPETKTGSGWDIPAFITRMTNHRGMVVEGSYDFEGPRNSIRWFLAVWDDKYKYIQDSYKYIEDQFAPVREHDLSFREWCFLYDLENDPGEKRNIIQDYPAVTRRMLDIVADWERRVPPVPLPPPSEEDKGTYPPGLVEQLKALGYMR